MAIYQTYGGYGITTDVDAGIEHIGSHEPKRFVSLIVTYDGIVQVMDIYELCRSMDRAYHAGENAFDSVYTLGVDGATLVECTVSIDGGRDFDADDYALATVTVRMSRNARKVAEGFFRIDGRS